MTTTLDVLVLGGTAWLSGTVARQALARGHRVTCLSRGISGEVPDGAELVVADRWASDAYDAVVGRSWDAVVDVSREPEQVRSAVAALAEHVGHWVYVSSVSVYPISGDPGTGTGTTVPAWTGSGQVPSEEYAGAKVACEQACREGLPPERLAVARAGLIAGYGDPSDRFGYWPARIADVEDEDEVVLVPPLDTPVQVIDVEDVARWVLHAAEHRVAGTYDVVGDQITFESVLEESALAAGVEPTVADPDEEWLLAQGVVPWSGKGSLPLWLPRASTGLVRRQNLAAKRVGLTLRPLSETVADALRWEQELGYDRERAAGLTAQREYDLLTELIGESDD